MFAANIPWLTPGANIPNECLPFEPSKAKGPGRPRRVPGRWNEANKRTCRWGQSLRPLRDHGGEGLPRPWPAGARYPRLSRRQAGELQASRPRQLVSITLSTSFLQRPAQGSSTGCLQSGRRRPVIHGRDGQGPETETSRSRNCRHLSSPPLPVPVTFERKFEKGPGRPEMRPARAVKGGPAPQRRRGPGRRTGPRRRERETPHDGWVVGASSS